jgi:deaminated glutathione amidase
MKTALIQMNSVSDKAANLAACAALVDQAVALEQPDWLMMPEHFEWAGGSNAEKRAAAEPLKAGSTIYDFCRDLARRHRVYLHAGSVYERIEGDTRLHNTSIIFDRDGREVVRYRKIHLFDITTPDGTPYHESASIKPGQDIVTYDCEGIRIGCAICYDLRFPDLFQALVMAGSQVIALPASFTLATGKDHWEVLLRARAIETQCYVLAAAQCGAYDTPGGKRFTYGHSLAVDPWGHVVARTSDGPGFVTTRLDMALVAQTRQQIPLAAHRVIGVEKRSDAA